MSQCSRELYQWELQRLLVTPKPPLDIFLDMVRVLYVSMTQKAMRSIPHGGYIDPFLVTARLLNWYPACGMVHIKDPLLLIGKSSPCNSSSRFPLLLSGSLPYFQCYITITSNVLSALLIQQMAAYTIMLWLCCKCL